MRLLLRGVRHSLQLVVQVSVLLLKAVDGLDIDVILNLCLLITRILPLKLLKLRLQLLSLQGEGLAVVRETAYFILQLLTIQALLVEVPLGLDLHGVASRLQLLHFYQ
jgi:hypothetical protein